MSSTINTMISPRNIEALMPGQILFEEHSETFYEVQSIYQGYAHLIPFESKDYGSIVSNLHMYVTNLYISNYTLLPRA